MSDDTETVLIAYGSNLSSGTRSASQSFDHLVKTLQKRGLIVNNFSRLWASKAWPDPTDPPYINAVLRAETDLQPIDLLSFLHDLEAEAGRVRGEVKNAPRTLDLDLIAYGNHVITGESGLVLPHPRAAARGFVMGPLAEIWPDWVHPVLQRTAVELYAAATVATDAHPLAGEA